ncbi:Two-component sensor PilS [hydrothermal vent metagenome]|uniref:Two-component sensor PilS n=1 Tax=hydrothermal vent metagenome TaxID=652676 RepID=A0A3B1ABW1_9ZZZZ
MIEQYLIRPTPNRDNESSHSDSWKALSILNLYRFSVSGIFMVLVLSDNLVSPLGSSNQSLFLIATSLYFSASIIAWLFLQLQMSTFVIHMYAFIIIDTVSITLLMHASGGTNSGLAILLLITIAGGSIILPRSPALLFAAFASIAMLLEHYLYHINDTLESSNFIQPGLLGLAFFTTAGVGNLLADRIRESEALARRRGVDIANMSELTEHILERMQTGIIVLDAHNKVRLMNESAWYMIGMPSTGKKPGINQISPELNKRVSQWRESNDLVPSVIQLNHHHTEVMPRFAKISQDTDSEDVLIFLEDTAAMAQRAQQLKLASLGRLTASIAHEVRNPLGAISHASQLLEESKNIDVNDKRLISIISSHTSRVNEIIENILRLSRRDRTNPEIILLKSFIEQFNLEFAQLKNIDSTKISLNLDPENIKIRFDENQLRQILTNLYENGIRHAIDKNDNEFNLIVYGGITEDFKRPFLDIIDKGEGINSNVAQHIFEPFYTTSNEGTGLGLYLSRELAESNQAHLTYIAVDKGGSCFRLTFQDPRKHIN